MKARIFLTMLLMTVIFSFSMVAQEEKVIQDLLTNKIWYQVDSKTGEKLNIEHFYRQDGKFVRCVMPENRRTQYPQWMLREFYFSDTIVTKFNRKQVGKLKTGRYLVINECESKGKWQVTNYEISSLSDNRFELICVYPQKSEKFLFVNAKHQLTAEDTEDNTVMDRLVGKQWFNKFIYGKKNQSINPWYFTESKMVCPIFHRTKGGYNTEIAIWDYKLSNSIDPDYSVTEKSNKNGTFINSYSDIVVGEVKRSYNYEILNITNNLMYLRPHYDWKHEYDTEIYVSN